MDSKFVYSVCMVIREKCIDVHDCLIPKIMTEIKTFFIKTPFWRFKIVAVRKNTCTCFKLNTQKHVLDAFKVF